MLSTAQLTNTELVHALEHDSRFFVNFFLAEEIKVPVPDLHVELLDLMVHEDVPKLSLAVPRGHAKTTLAKLAAVHHFLFSDFQYILYMSSTSGHSVPCVNDIIAFMESDNFVNTFGVVQFRTKQEGKGFYEFVMPNGKECILKAFGAGQKVRGTNIRNHRPQLVIVDDLEDNDNIANPELYLALKRWVYGPFRKCVDKFKNKWIWIGNLLKIESMLYENSRSPYWHTRTYGCLRQDGEPLWDDLWPMEALREDFAEYCDNGMADIWFAEMMNQPMAGMNAIIAADEITYLPAVQPREYPIGFLTIDLAISAEDWAHKTVVAAHAWIEERETWQIVETQAFKGIDPISLFRVVIAMGQNWGFRFVGIESVAYQAALMPVFEHLALIERIEGFTFEGVPARAQKQFRIIAWAAMVKSGEYALTEGDFHVTQELLSYDPTKKDNTDDTIDACAHGVTMLHLFTYDIMNQKDLDDGNKPPTAQDSYAVARH